MNTLPTRARAALLGVLLAPVFGLAGCTDLTVDPYSAVTPENFYQTETEVIAALSPVYSQLRVTLWAYHNLSQVSSDESIVPTRGGDWGDGGRWLDMHRHTWSPSLVDLNDAWTASYAGVARANSLLRDLEPLDVPNKAGIIAEVRALRAFYYYTLLDLFGNVPLIGDEEGEYSTDPDNLPPTETRETVFNFVVGELQAVRTELPVAGAGNGGRFSQGAADAILANLFINAPVFTGTVTASGLQPGAPRYQDAIDAATRVIDGPYQLNQGLDAWYNQFGPNNQGNPEQVFVVQHLPQDGYGLNFAHRWGHYNSFAGGGWNGFATIADTYNAFSEDDPRRVIFLQGRAYNEDACDSRVQDPTDPNYCTRPTGGETATCNSTQTDPTASDYCGDAINNRAGQPLIFTVDYPNGVNGAATEANGVRINKFDVDPNRGPNGHHSNDYAYFRLGEMYLIRAEARLRNGDAGGALSDVNVLRDRVGAPELNSIDLNGLLAERLFELTYEARRRQDLVRFGRFTDAWSFKDASQGYRVLFPIPQIQIDASDGLLQQNAGY